jgi:hypothetical protein
MASKNAIAQKGVNDTIVVGSIVINNDTLPHIWLHDAYCIEKGNKDYFLIRIPGIYQNLLVSIPRKFLQVIQEQVIG